MNTKMTRLALGGKCGGLGASGFSGWVSASRVESPSMPNPHAESRRRARREMGRERFDSGFILVYVDEVIGGHENPAKALPGSEWRCRLGEVSDVFQRIFHLI